MDWNTDQPLPDDDTFDDYLDRELKKADEQLAVLRGDATYGICAVVGTVSFCVVVAMVMSIIRGL